jgi:hypothetical protein
MTSTAKFVIAWAAVALVICALLAPINIPTFVALIRHGDHTAGRIVKADCENHASAFYDFVVGAKSYSGHDRIPDCKSLRTGDKIEVYYDIRDPTLSSAYEPNAGLSNEMISIGISCLIAPPLVIFTFAQWMRRQKKNMPNQTSKLADS